MVLKCLSLLLICACLPLAQTRDGELFRRIRGTRNVRGGAVGTSTPEIDIRETVANLRSNAKQEPEASDNQRAAPQPRSWLDQLPEIKLKIDPTTTVKLRKSFFPLKTKLTVGADFNTQLSVWQFKTTWEDRIIGGRITVKGRELQLTKSWMLALGDREDLAARLRFKLGVDLYSGRTYCRFGFRTEESSPPINLLNGLPLDKKFPLDPDSHVNLEVKSRIAVPTPNLEFKSELAPGKQLELGMGDVEISVDEVNLCLEY